MRTLKVAAVALLVLAGCVRPEATNEPTSVPIVEPGQDVQATPNATRSRSLLEAPDWRMGEWWTIELKDHYFDHTYRATRVVAQREGDNWLVGMPTHAWSNEVMIFHVPGMGEVNATDLSFEVHDSRFHPVKFPLTLGKTWDTEFETRPMRALVEDVKGDRARIHFWGTAPGSSEHFNVTYDAQVGDVVLFDHPTYVEYRLLEHGFGFDRMVTVPHGHDLVFMHGRFGPLKGTNPPDVGSGPFEQVTVPTTYDRVSFVLIAGSPLTAPSPAPGVPAPPQTYYRETAVAPNGTAFELVVSSEAELGDFRASFHRYEKPGGLWELEHVALGPGLAFIEGIGYHVYDVELPEGRILPSSGEHKHGGDDHHH